MFAQFEQDRDSLIGGEKEQETQDQGGIIVVIFVIVVPGFVVWKGLKTGNETFNPENKSLQTEKEDHASSNWICVGY
jgi:hypothetical protein